MDPDTSEFFRTIIEHIQDSIFLINQSGTIVFAAQEQNKGLEGTPFLDAVFKIHHNRVRSAIHCAFETKRAATFEMKGWIGTAQASWFSCRISPVLKGNAVSSALVFASDMAVGKGRKLSR